MSSSYQRRTMSARFSGGGDCGLLVATCFIIMDEAPEDDNTSDGARERARGRGKKKRREKRRRKKRKRKRNILKLARSTTDPNVSTQYNYIDKMTKKTI
mmetsp:Transcript_28915/g.71384  ORF Transcript_28915/g.71384 Transcript_28915/m.71384 type:complete len:99 (-) Transcript_28915:124-420(-)